MDYRPEKYISLDTENDPDGQLGQWSIAFRGKDNQLCLLAETRATRQRELSKLFDSCGVVFHNYKWDSRVLTRNNMPIPKSDHVFDTMIAAYCLGLSRQAPKDSGKAGDQMVGGLGLKYLARRHLGMKMRTWEEVKDHPEWIPEYNADDSVSTLLLWEKWKDKLPQHFWDIDMPLLPVLMGMEDRGICVDPLFLGEYSKVLDKQLSEITLPFDANNDGQIRKYLYEDLKIEPTQFTKINHLPSVAKDVLETIDDPVVKDLLKWNKLAQERNTYVKNYTKTMGPDSRIHAEFKQTSTSTGRPSAVNPNLYNVAKTDLRKLFVAGEGKWLVRYDASQIELRVLAAISQDPVMLGVFARGEDIHQDTANRLHLSRDDAKVPNFLTSYGGTAWAIAKEFHITIEAAKEFQAAYFRAYPGVGMYMDRMREIAKRDKVVEDFFGRKRRLDAMFSEDWRIRQEGEKEAINMPIQATASEIEKLVMINLHNVHHAPMLLHVYDEVLFEIDGSEKRAEEYARWLESYVPTVPGTEINGVKFPVEVGWGRNWQEAAKKRNKDGSFKEKK